MRASFLKQVPALPAAGRSRGGIRHVRKAPRAAGGSDNGKGLAGELFMTRRLLALDYKRN